MLQAIVPALTLQPPMPRARPPPYFPEFYLNIALIQASRKYIPCIRLIESKLQQFIPLLDSESDTVVSRGLDGLDRWLSSASRPSDIVSFTDDCCLSCYGTINVMVSMTCTKFPQFAPVGLDISARTPSKFLADGDLTHAD